MSSQDHLLERLAQETQEQLRQKQEETQSASLKLKASIEARKADALRKKEEDARLEEERRLAEEAERQRLNEEKRRRREEELQRQRDEAQRLEEEKRHEAEEKARALKEKQKALIEAQKLEAQRRREEEEAQKQVAAQEKARVRDEKIAKIKAASSSASSSSGELPISTPPSESEDSPTTSTKETAEERAERKRQAVQRRQDEERQRLEEARRQREEAERLAIEKRKAAIQRAKEEKLRREQETAGQTQADETSAAPEEETLSMKDKIAKRKEESKKRQDEERLALEQKMADDAERLRRVQEEQKQLIQRQKEEAARRRQEEEQAAAQERLERETEARRKEEELRQKLIKARESNKARNSDEDVLQLVQQRDTDLKSARQEQIASLKKHKEDAARQREEAEREQREQREREKQEQKQLALERIKRSKEEAALKKLEQERIAAEELQARKEEARAREEARKESLRRIKEEARLKLEQEELAEREARAEATRQKQALIEQQRIAREKHAEEVRKKREEERDLEEEERQKREAERALEFDREMKRQQDEVSLFIKQEEARLQRAAEKVKELEALGKNVSSGGVAVVNRCGLFSEFGAEPGLEIWVLGDQQISKLATQKHGLRGLIGECHGTFHVARAYVVLHTEFKRGMYTYHLHGWIGSQADEENRKQLEERLSELEGGLLLHNLESFTRETEGEESDAFKAYFPDGIEYIRPVNLRNTQGPNFRKKRMYQLKGRYRIRAFRVPARPESLNSGDVFVLEDNDAIYQWNGKKSNKMERGKALDITVQLRIERNARVPVIIIDEGNPQCEHETKKFWAALMLDKENPDDLAIFKREEERTGVTGATPSGLEVPVKSADESQDDVEWENQYLASIRLTRVVSKEATEDSSSSSSSSVEQFVDVPLNGKTATVDQLDGKSCFIFDCKSEIFVWFGNQSSVQDRQACKSRAIKIASERPDQEVEITKVRQQCETILFREKFEGDWGEYTDFDFSQRTTGNIANLQQKEVNIDEMHHPAKWAIANEGNNKVVPNRSASDESSLEIWLIGEKDRRELPIEEYGHFYTAHCYLLIYRVSIGQDQQGKPMSRHVVYYWQGYDSGREDRGTSAVLAGDISQKLRFSQCVRVLQNKEPDHFLSHFAPSFVVTKGRRPASNNGRLPTEGVHLYHIRGNNELNAHAVEAQVSGSMLNSNDSFVLLDLSTEASRARTFIWNGVGSNAFEQAAASAVVDLVSASGHFKNIESVSITEGNDDNDAFWTLLGGKQAYCDFEYLKRADLDFRPKLFQCSNSIGIFRLIELTFDNVKLFQTGGVEKGDGYVGFAQDDLTERDVYIIDGGSSANEVWVWHGANSNEQCQQMALDTVQKYLAFEDDTVRPRKDSASITIAKAGEEPVGFRAYFHGWDVEMASASKDTYTARLKLLQQAQAKK